MRYYFAIFITIVLFSTIEVTTKMIGGNIDPIYLAFLRFFVSGIIIISLDIKKITKVRIKDLYGMFVMGLVGITIALGAFHSSLQYIEASKGAVIFSSNPIFSTLFAGIIFKEAISIRRWSGIIIGFIGVYIVSFGFKIIEFSSIKGPILMFISAVLFGFYIVYTKKYIKKYGTFFTTGFIFITGALCYVPFIKSFNIVYSETTITYIAYLVLVATGIAYVCYFYGLKHVPISVGTAMFYIKPLLASVLSVVILHERLGINYFIGLIVIFIGLTLTIINDKKKLN